MGKKVVIVGGGFGGIEAAKALAKVDVEITVVDRENHHLFQPLLYQVATASLAPGSIAVPIRSVLASQENARVVLGEAMFVDKEARELTLRDGTVLDYDYLIVACGAKTSYFGRDEWAAHAHGMKDIRDAIRIRERVLLAFEAAEREGDIEEKKELLTFVVIGGGPTGVETAGAISELGRQVLAGDYRNIAPGDIRVVLVEMGERVLSGMSDPLSHDALRQLEELGVEVRLRTRVEDVFAGGVRLRDLRDEDAAPEELEASLVVWAAGVQPVSFAQRLDVSLSKRGQIVVDKRCAVLGHPEIFAIGDIAHFVPEGDEWPLPGVAPVAIQQGRHAAAQIQRDLQRRARQDFVYKDKGMMATIGRSRAVAQTDKMEMSGLMAWLAWGLIHIMYLVGFRNRLIVLFNWVWSYVTFKRGARLIVARHDEALEGGDDKPSPLHAAVPARARESRTPPPA